VSDPVAQRNARERAAGQLLLFVVLLLMGGLFALTGMRQFFIEPLASTRSNIIWFVIQVAPLLVIVPGMLRMHYRSCFFAILVASLYFIHGVLLAVSESLRLLGFAEVGISLALILAATYLLRGLRAAQQS
jgi:uncharacterized membrane protein